jgi:hypothetical protein
VDVETVPTLDHTLERLPARWGFVFARWNGTMGMNAGRDASMTRATRPVRVTVSNMLLDMFNGHPLAAKGSTDYAVGNC